MDALVRVRYWASARAAAGCSEQEVAFAGPFTLADLVVELGAQNPGLARILPTCSVLVGEQPVGSADPGDVVLADGAQVEFLPPFAGG